MRTLRDDRESCWYQELFTTPKGTSHSERIGRLETSPKEEWQVGWGGGGGGEVRLPFSRVAVRYTPNRGRGGGGKVTFFSGGSAVYS